MKHVAVVGGGIFGATAALYAAREGHEVHLFERERDLLQGASTVNQYRLHRGYHYPRSSATVQECLMGERSFRAEFGDSIVSGTRHLYAIAKVGSRTSYESFLEFCRAEGLEYIPTAVPDMVDPAQADVIEVNERSFDPKHLRNILRARLEQRGVRMHFGVVFSEAFAFQFDKIIVATYAQLNSVLSHMGCQPTEKFQFEVCEKPVITVPAPLARIDIVVMDGSFGSLGPLGQSNLHVIGHVAEAIHSTNVGYYPEVPDSIKYCINKGLIINPACTFWQKIVQAGSQFIPLLRHAQHVGSMYAIRAVLPDRDQTDERLTRVVSVGDRIITIFSGKIATCVEAARTAIALI